MSCVSARCDPKQRTDMLGDGQARCQPGRFDTEQVDEAGDTMRFRSLDEKVGAGGMAIGDLWADAAIGGLQGVIWKIPPILPDLGIEAVCTSWVDGIVDAVDPFDVRAEPGLATEIECQVDAESARFRNGIDQPRERRSGRKGKIVSLGIVGLRYMLGGKSCDA